MALPFPYPSIAARRNSLTIPPPIHSFSSSSSSSSSSFCPRLLAAVACRRESTNRLPVRSSNSFTEKKEEEEQEDEDEDSGSDFQTGPSGRSGQYSDESVNDSVLKDFKWRLMDYNPLPAIVNPSPAGIDYSSVQDLKVRLEDYHPPVIVNPSLAGIDFSSVQVTKNEDLEKLTKLGAGAFGTVFHAKWKGIDVAIKRMNKFGSMVTPPEQLTRILKFLREAKMLSNLRHPNVVAFYGVVQDGSWETLDAVTEYMHDGSLRNVLLQKDRHLDQHQKHQIAQQVAAAMEYLHSKNVVHFDLKCDNLLVDWKDPRHPICKVGDVGLSEIKRKNLVSGGPRGTIPWMAPELFHGSSNKVSEKVDVYSYGIVLWEMLTGEEPYANMHYGAIVDGVVNYNLRPTIPSDCDPEWSRLIALCWAPNPAARPSFTEIAAQLRTMSVAAAAAAAR